MEHGSLFVNGQWSFHLARAVSSKSGFKVIPKEANK